jgi:hypothetical protein
MNIDISSIVAMSDKSLAIPCPLHVKSGGGCHNVSKGLTLKLCMAKTAA